MNINGLIKLTLLDFPGKTACTVFFAGCNLRCPFCHNADLVLHSETAEHIPEEEFFAFLKRRQGLLDGVCVTGGEPLLQPGLAPFLRRIRELGFAVKLDTNGFFPERLQALVEQGLVDYIAMDIKNTPARYSQTVGLPSIDLSGILESVTYIKSCGVAYEFRTTLVRELHTKEGIAEIAGWLSGSQQYFLQGYKDSPGVIQPGFHAFNPAEMQEILALVRQKVPNAALRGV